MRRVAELPCVLCGTEPCEVHHLREGQGMRIQKLDELDLLSLTIEALAK